jgi:hypothetical protein
MEERAAIRWIGDVRRLNRNNRTTTNDILVDALWYFLENAVGKTKEDIRALVPSRPPDERQENKVTQMPKPKK